MLSNLNLLALQDTLFSVLSEKIYSSLIKEDRFMLLWQGLKVTLWLTVLALLLGIILGLFTAIVRIRKIPILTAIANTYVSIIRGTPLVVQLTIIYFVILADINLSKVFVASIAFGINSGAYVSEIIRGGILAVDKGQMEAARSLGLSYKLSMQYVIIPQAVKNILPAMGNEMIVLFKETSIAGYISLGDLSFAAKSINANTYDYFTPLILVAYIYFIITLLLSRLLTKYERRLRTSD